MRRFVETSGGPLALDVTYIRLSGVSVVATAYGEDAGWESSTKSWNERYSDESLAEAIAEVGGVPADEAQRVADETLEQWRARGGESADRADERTVTKYLVGTFGLAAFGACAVLALLAWLLIGWL